MFSFLLFKLISYAFTHMIMKVAIVWQVSKYVDVIDASYEVRHKKDKTALIILLLNKLRKSTAVILKNNFLLS